MINKVTLIGRLGQDSEVKQLQNSTLTKFSLATSESYKDKNDEWVENTQWHNITFWKEFNAKKGDMVYIEGKIQYREYEGKYYTDIVADRCRNLSGKSSGITEQKPELPEPTNGQMTAMKIKVKRGELTIKEIEDKFSLTLEQLTALRSELPSGSPEDDDLPF